MKSAIITTLIGSAAAFAPAQTGKASTQRRAFENELGAVEPVGFFDPLGTPPAPVATEPVRTPAPVETEPPMTPAPVATESATPPAPVANESEDTTPAPVATELEDTTLGPAATEPEDATPAPVATEPGNVGEVDGVQSRSAASLSSYTYSLVVVCIITGWTLSVFI
mmetsp:Transcript_41042/g.75107  ORF Transcript_41042/g.75107 Transcript_41042/m.75107 type:complete len:167 (-) Transcript_41042:183-683(-)